ncbi:MAG: MFS transporter [Actinobacteria bacterium]|nr:MFS transporter [Actinomycetota bacterium]
MPRAIRFAAVYGETDVAVAGYEGIDQAEYRKRIRAWTMYDWANSAFATTILAAVLPTYYSNIAASTLPSRAIATAYWSAGLSISLFVVALLSPILGTISDLKRGKKRFLSIFAGTGIVATGLLVLVGSGDWLLASLLFVIGRIGFAGSVVFYDSLLPHVARPEDQDRVSSLGYAIGYVGGGLLLVVNVVMIFVIGDEWGSRLSFLSVAVWWAVFSIPVLRRVPEPPAAVEPVEGSVLTAGFRRLRETFGHIRKYKELAKYLAAFFIYNDGIGTIIGVAVIYGAELGFGTVELVLALVLVQFAGIPFTLAFGRIPGGQAKRAPVYLAFVLLNLVMLPLIGGIGGRTLDADLVGRPGADFEATATAVGQGEHFVTDAAVDLDGGWSIRSADAIGAAADFDYATTDDGGDTLSLTYHGREVAITYGKGPGHGEWAVAIDGVPVEDEDADEDGTPLVVDGYNAAERYGEVEIVDAGEAGEHTLTITNTGTTGDAEATGTAVTIGRIEVLEPTRESSLGSLLGLLLLVEIAAAGIAFVIGPPLLKGVAARMTTKRTIMLALTVYSAIAVWGFFLDTVIEFWFLAWMVAVVQGGSQALSRSLYASMSPASMSGEFFGFFGIMEKFSAILGPLLFTAAAFVFDSSRPAVLGLIVLFIVGGYLLTRVDVDEGRRVAAEADRTGQV